MSLEELFEKDPYGLSQEQKELLFVDRLTELTDFHKENCPEYGKILSVLGYDKCKVEHPEDIPFIPVRLFKEYDLLSVPRDSILKIMTSSGTSGQKVSKIYLDKTNTLNQTKALTSIISSYIGKKRLPLLLLDTEMVKTDRTMFSARGAGIVGFSTFGRNTTYALDKDMQIDFGLVEEFCEKHRNETVLMFGYTYMIWQYVIRALEEKGKTFPFSKVIVFHIGGWKKLKDQAVSTLEYNRRLSQVLGGNVEVHNYYGMAEQLGSVFVECEYGHMHCSNFSDIIIRDHADFSAEKVGERGLIELLSLLPSSYPGHALLTEDEGEILGIDDCPCGRRGKYFKIHGRIKGAELRGCSDTYERH